MTAIEILENKTANLIPIINPGLKGESGIRAALLYRICPSIESLLSLIMKPTAEVFQLRCLHS
ncbi:hypothetical protein [[Clostridium] aminophilum]|uniref:hypothetical protein n=1 Tax=[Clostridium] aminophilum TaxID=1526 RepID=UPI001160B2E7|nr:hypothetical protein [[Clostridium] aminophilum]